MLLVYIYPALLEEECHELDLQIASHKDTELPGSTSVTLEKFCLAHRRVRQLKGEPKLDTHSNLSSEEGPQLEVVCQEVIVTTNNYADADTQSAFAEEVIGMGTGPIVKGLKRHSNIETGAFVGNHVLIHRREPKPTEYKINTTEYL